MKSSAGTTSRVNKDGTTWVCTRCSCRVREALWVYRRHSPCRVGNSVCSIFIESSLAECHAVPPHYDPSAIKIRAEFWSMDLFSKTNNSVFIISSRANYDVTCRGNWIEHSRMWIDFAEFNVFLQGLRRNSWFWRDEVDWNDRAPGKWKADEAHFIQSWLNLVRYFTKTSSSTKVGWT